MSNRKFRRPAMLDPQQAEDIVGDVDPAEEVEIAHTSAWALLGVPEGDFDQEHVERLRAAVHTSGVDVVAGFWDRSSENTLAGALWRIYLLWQWNQLNPAVVQQRYEEGVAALTERGELPEELPGLREVIMATGAVLAGVANEDQLAPVFEAAALTMDVMAAGVAWGPLWIDSDEHELAHPVTRRPLALVDTARELRESARRAHQGTLG